VLRGVLSCQKILLDVRDRCVGIGYRLSERVPIAIADRSWLDDESVVGPRCDAGFGYALGHSKICHGVGRRGQSSEGTKWEVEYLGDGGDLDVVGAGGVCGV
jgi:hypothetical protein